ncbi:MAG: hypothetical protein J3K34DRAFT_487705 [Monoraphidium minutum]|nr:MAG: hypothetical protein J3K34DRAFT_487705 [Monoraphidium minutum]
MQQPSSSGAGAGDSAGAPPAAAGPGCAARPVSDPATGSWAREMTDTYGGGGGGDDGEAADPDWSQQATLSKRAVALSCGAFGVGPAAGAAHRHDAGELAAAAALAGELAGVLEGVDIHMGDESDHRLAPFFAAAILGAAPPAEITDELVRGAAFGGALDPRYPLTLRPLPAPEGYPPAGGAAGAVAPAALEAGARFVSMHEPRRGEPPARPAPDAGVEEKRAYYRAMKAAQPMGCIFPKMFLALTRGGSIVGAAAVVVHT